MKIHPGVRVEQLAVPNRTFAQYYRTQLIGGAELEGIPWRDTFIDGLNSKYNQNLLDYYMISTAMFTVRVYYNQALWREILDDRPVPETYEDFRQACEDIQASAAETGRSVLPIAASKYNGPQLDGKALREPDPEAQVFP